MLAGKYSKVLIAQRGEAAARVARTCRQLGVKTIAVYSDPEGDGMHVGTCDEALQLKSNAQGAIDADELVSIAKASKVDAVHLGYEGGAAQATLAPALRDAGIDVIGAVPEAAAKLGDEVSTKKITEQVGLRWLSAENGIDRGRYISVLLAADTHGDVVAIGEIDRSIQADGLALVEESPSPEFLFNSEGESIRMALFEVATQTCTHLKATGLITMDFVLDADLRFWWLGARFGLPRQHAHLEMVSEIDLVGLQLQIASGEPLAEHLYQVQPKGHSIGVVVLANADQDLSKAIEEFYATPSSTGRLRNEVSVTKDARFGVDDNAIVTKITAHAAVRHQAMHMVDRTLASLVVQPLQTNKDRLRNILANHSYRAGRCDAEFVKRTEAEQLNA